jgi:hypothetical protein
LGHNSTSLHRNSRYDVGACTDFTAVVFLCFSGIDAAIGILIAYLNNTYLITWADWIS